MLGAGISLLIFLIQWRIFDLRSWPDTMKVLGSVVLASVLVLVGSLLWNLLSVPAELDNEKPSFVRSKLTLLFVDLDYTYGQREDLGCPITLRPVIRSDYRKPTGVQAVRWEPHSSMVKAGFRTAGLNNGLQIQRSGEWNPRWPGTDRLLLNSNDVFRAGIRTEHANPVDLERMRDDHELGTITFLVENEEESLLI